MKFQGELVRLPLPVEDPAEEVWHYTDAAGLVGIITDGAVRASSFRTLNDRDEILYGLDVIRDAIQEYEFRSTEVSRQQVGELLVEDILLKDIRDISLVFCTSTNGDSLNQWQHYSGRQGYAIKFRRGHAWKIPPAPADGSLPIESLDQIGVYWRKVIYDRAKQKQLVSEILRFLEERAPRALVDGSHIGHRDIARRLLAVCIASFKHDGFSAEQEVRYVRAPPREATLKFRPSARGIVPYIELKFEKSWVRTPEREHTTSLMEVRCGPGTELDQAEDEANVGSLLRTFEYPEAIVSSSTIPYRF